MRYIFSDLCRYFIVASDRQPCFVCVYRTRALLCRAKAKGSICLLTSMFILPFAFADPPLSYSHGVLVPSSLGPTLSARTRAKFNSRRMFSQESSTDGSGTQQTQNICIPVVQRRPSVGDVGPTLYKCYTNILCLLGMLSFKTCERRSAQRVAPGEINVNTLVSTLTRRVRHKRDHLVTLRVEKQWYFSERPK